MVYALYLRGSELFDATYCGSQYYDAGDYYSLSQSFHDATGRFQLLAFNNTLRGYLWPWVLTHFYPATAVGTAAPAGDAFIKAFRPLGVALAALLFGLAGPLLWTRLRGAAPTWGRQAIFAGLGFVFWRDYFHFALSDMPAVLALTLALVLALGHRPRVVEAALAGLLVAAATIIRPVFVLAAGILLVGAVWHWWREHPARTTYRLALLGALVGGAGVVLLPQSLINQRYYGQATPLVLGWLNAAHPRSLYLDQLSWGLQMQKYETSVAPDRGAQMIYADPAGLAVLRGTGLPQNEWGFPIFPSVSSYVYTLLKQWPDMSLVYARHLFNGLDIRQSTPYLRPFSRWALALAGLNYAVLFAALLVVVFGRPALDPGRTAVVLVAVLLPAAVVLPTAIEVRFLLPLHLLIYGLVAFGWPSHWTGRFFRHHPRRSALLLAGGGFVLWCFLLSAAANSHLTGGNGLLAP